MVITIAGLILMIIQGIGLVIGASLFEVFGLLGSFMFLIGLTVVGRTMANKNVVWFASLFIGLILLMFFVITYLMAGGMLL
jgi:hypothetical protein